MSVKLLTEHHLEFLSLKGGCTGSSESTLIKMPIVGNHMSWLIYLFQLKATVLYIHPLSKAAALTCLPFIVNSNGVSENQFPDMSQGLIIPDATVKNVDKRGVYLKLADKITGCALVSLTLFMLGNFTCVMPSADFFKRTFSKNSFRNTLRVSNSLDPDQARHFVGPDLGLKCLHRLSAGDTRRQRVLKIALK